MSSLGLTSCLLHYFLFTTPLPVCCITSSLLWCCCNVYRIQNLELLQEYGSTVWKNSNDLLVKLLNTSQQRLQEVRKQIQDINWQRKNEQIEAGTKLKNLEDRSVDRNFERTTSIIFGAEMLCIDIWIDGLFITELYNSYIK